MSTRDFIITIVLATIIVLSIAKVALDSTERADRLEYEKDKCWMEGGEAAYINELDEMACKFSNRVCLWNNELEQWDCKETIK